MISQSLYAINFVECRSAGWQPRYWKSGWMKWEKTEIGNLKVDRTHCAQKSIAPIQQCVHHFCCSKGFNYPEIPSLLFGFSAYLFNPRDYVWSNQSWKFDCTFRGTSEKGSICCDSGDLVQTFTEYSDSRIRNRKQLS